MSYRWRYERTDGTELTGAELPEVASNETFPAQGDAETWVGEVWRELLAGGVDAVTLLEDARVVYGPMSLHAS